LITQPLVPSSCLQIIWFHSSLKKCSTPLGIREI
jgi:hypothetical protein